MLDYSNTRKRRHNNIKHENSMCAMVWKDGCGTWHLSLATSKEKLVQAIMPNNKALDLNYRLFDSGEYNRALDYKHQMEKEDRFSNEYSRQLY